MTLITLLSFPVYANADGSEELIEANSGEDKVIGDKKTEVKEEDKNKGTVIEEGINTNEFKTDPVTDKNSGDKKISSDKSSLKKGGNEKAVNEYATEQNTARGTVKESVGVDNKDYPTKVLTDEDKKNMTIEELRQFITFQTKSGKEMHIIIDHSKMTNNVMLLTEVGEQDLLNMIEEETGEKLVVKEKKEDIPVETELPKPKVEVKKEPETKGSSQYIIIGVIALLFGVLAYYFKIYKPKQDSFDDDEDFDEAEYIEESYEKDDAEEETEESTDDNDETEEDYDENEPLEEDKE